MNEENLYIRFDWAIKHILRDKANDKIPQNPLDEWLSI